MIISDIKWSESTQGVRLSASARPQTVAAGVCLDPWFEIAPAVGPIGAPGDPFAAGFLVPCMFLGEDLRIEGQASPELLAGIERVQEILSVWNRRLRRINVSAAHQSGRTTEQRRDCRSAALTSAALRSGCFFSGGVDAWYTLCKHEHEVSDLVLIRGFDVPIGANDDIWRQAQANVRSVATAMGKKAIEVQTNLRALTDLRRAKWGGWGPAYDGDFWGTSLHGSCLAAVALCLQGALRRIFVGATYTYDHLEPWGSHPLLDPLWSTAALQVIHDGAEANRMQKIKRIAESALALSSLRVCYENRDQMYNCCQCEKCCRTMMALRACGRLEAASSFTRPLDLSIVKRRVHDAHVLPWYRAIVPFAQEAGDVKLVDTLRVVLGEKFCLEQAMAQARETIRGWTPASLRPMLSYAASRRRWRARMQRLMPLKSAAGTA